MHKLASFLYARLGIGIKQVVSWFDMNNKNTTLIIGTIAVLALILATLYRAEPADPVSEPLPLGAPDSAREPGVDPGTPATSGGIGKLKADVFSGTLEAVDTGCFADGECFVVVDGKHVTALRGWSRDTVGSVQGVEGFGDLESHIGTQIEVYAQVLEDGTYTLYGSEGFYIKLLTTGGGGGGADDTPGTPVPMPPVVGTGCVVGGCSSQLCGEASEDGDMVSTCEWREEYGCYRSATCERQASGKCGWTVTPELTACLESASASTI